MVFSSFLFLCVKESSHFNNRKNSNNNKNTRARTLGDVCGIEIRAGKSTGLRGWKHYVLIYFLLLMPKTLASDGWVSLCPAHFYPCLPLMHFEFNRRQPL